MIRKFKVMTKEEFFKAWREYGLADTIFRSAFRFYLINLNELLLCVSWALSQALEIQRWKSVVLVFHYQRIGVEVMEREKDLSFRLSQTSNGIIQV